MFNPPSVATTSEQEAARWQDRTAESGDQESRQRIDSASLLRGGRELLIAHAGEEYQLRLTRNNRLILTK
ncbi:MAG: hemin uptake protein HemP [Dokdonella sp.]